MTIEQSDEVLIRRVCEGVLEAASENGGDVISERCKAWLE